MYETIDDLYFGNINPYAKNYEKNTAHQNALKLYRRLYDEALNEIPERHHELLEKLCDTLTELSCEEEKAMFIEGFRLGLRLTAECFMSCEE